MCDDREGCKLEGRQTSYEKLGEEVEKDYVNPKNGAGKITLDME